MRFASSVLLFLLSACGGWQLNPHAARSNARGAAHLAASDWQQAEAAFRVALEIDPRYAVARSNLALVLFQQGQLERAQQEAESATEANGDIAEPWNVLGAIAEQRRELAFALECFERALRIDPTYLAARLNAVRVSSDMGMLNRARIHAERAAEVESVPGIAVALLAVLEARDGEYGMARAHANLVLTALRETTAPEPRAVGDARLRSMAQTFGISLEDPEQRAQDQNRARRRAVAQEGCPFAHFALAIVDTREGHPDAAARHQRAFQHIPSLVVAAHALAIPASTHRIENEEACVD